MASLSRIKRQIVRQAVDENLDTINGVLPGIRNDRSRSEITLLSVFFYVALPAAVFALSYILSPMAVGEATDSRLAATRAPVRRAEPVVAEAGVPAESTTTYASPRPLDPAVMPLTLRRVVLDPGHGGSNLGTVAPGGLPEKVITLDIADRLRQLLEDHGYDVVMTRETDESKSLKKRGDMANEAEGDIFLSIHVNWIELQEIRGIETFYLGPTDDPYVTELAATENQGSGYSLADFRGILERVYADVRQKESRELATAVQSALFDSLTKVNPTVRNRGVKSAPFGVLVRTEMPAILAEVSCLSNALEARLLAMPSYRQLLAEALFSGIDSYARELNQAYQIGG
ncbi:MAG: N-acetylmuramoyl-L-alanine amidase [Acidobacteria bacterium]|nr:MAG: N-acetylmuramoyl-L-alanine amidase [Acidobacteriota bacterium]